MQPKGKMEKKSEEEIPEWKLPPADKVLRRESGDFKQRRVEKRQPSRNLQTDETECLPVPLHLEDEKYYDVLRERFAPELSSTSILKSRSDNSINICKVGEDEENRISSSHHKSNDKSLRTKKQGRTKSSGNPRVVNVNLTNRFKSAGHSKKEISFSDNFIHNFESHSGLESRRKWSLPAREQTSQQTRPRSQSLHLQRSHHEDYDLPGDQRPRCKSGRVASNSLCSKSRTLNKSINDAVNHYNDNIKSSSSASKLLDFYPIVSNPNAGLVEGVECEHRSKAKTQQTEATLTDNKGSSMPCPSTPGSDRNEDDKDFSNREGSGKAGMPNDTMDEIKNDSALHLDEQSEPGSSEYDTDCEPDENSPLNGEECKAKRMREDADFGHLTYESACSKYKVMPRRRILSQLRGPTLALPHGGLTTAEVQALGPALQKNNRIEQVDLSGNFLTPEALSVVSQAVVYNVNILSLNLSQSTFDSAVAKTFSDLLCFNHWLVNLDLSDCSIGDNEIEPLTQGIQKNCRLETLNLCKNSIGVVGALQLGRALGENDSLRIVDLSWNHIRGGGAVAVCHSLIKNTSMEELDLSWNGIGFEGSLALGSALKQNSTLKRLNLTNNRINWDCAPHLSPALAANSSLECLELGQNPISMEGCEEILSGVSKPRSNLRFLSFSGIPINTKIVMIATEITKMRPFTLDHGGILNTRDVIGIQRARREDPFSLLIRYLSAMGIRVMDLFRMMDKDNSLHVSRQKFIQGLKRVRVPLDDEDIMLVAKRLQSDKHGLISYQELAANVRNRIREDRLEDKRQEILLKKKKEERRRILQSDRPLNAPSYLPTLYNMFGTSELIGNGVGGGTMSVTPGGRILSRGDRLFSASVIGSFSRRGSSFSVLPRIASGGGGVKHRKVGGAAGKTSASASDSPVMTLVGQNTPSMSLQLHHGSAYSPAASQRSSAKGEKGAAGGKRGSISSCVNDLGLLENTPKQSKGQNLNLPTAERTRWRQSAQDLVALRAKKLI